MGQHCARVQWVASLQMRHANEYGIHVGCIHFNQYFFLCFWFFYFTFVSRERSTGRLEHIASTAVKLGDDHLFPFLLLGCLCADLWYAWAWLCVLESGRKICSVWLRKRKVPNAVDDDEWFIGLWWRALAPQQQTPNHENVHEIWYSWLRRAFIFFFIYTHSICVATWNRACLMVVGCIQSHRCRAPTTCDNRAVPHK